MLSDQAIIEILNDWSFWDQPPPAALRRRVLLPKSLAPDLAFIIQGLRRCGKSTLLSQLPKRYDLPLAQCFFCNFEDPRLMNDLDHHLLNQIKTIARKNISADKPCYFFLMKSKM